MAYSDIPRVRSFSLGDFHDFDRCVFRFFVNHHLEKKYELAEGNPNQTIGSLLDLGIKKLHQTKAYGEPLDYLVTLIKAAEVDMRQDIITRGKKSFYGAQLSFLTPEVIEKAQEVFKSYYQGINGKYPKLVLTETMKKIRPFWSYQIDSDEPLLIWGGPDSIEMGEDGVPEVVDYKFFGDTEKGQNNLDMDLMPKVYTLLTSKDLILSGFNKARFKVRFWQDPKNESFYEEFDLNTMKSLEEFFKDKIERILRTTSLSFCERDFCKVCKSDQREEWIAELKLKGYIKEESSVGAVDQLAVPDLPF